jgi:hypothetical protein
VKTEALWKAFRDRLAGQAGAPVATRGVTLQHLGFAEEELPSLQALLDQLGEQLALKLQLQGHGGEIVLLDLDFAARTPPQLLHAFNEDRPVVLVPGLQPEEDPLLSAALLLQRRQQEVLRQLQSIAMVRRRSMYWRDTGWAPESGLHGEEPVPLQQAELASVFDSDFDSRRHADELVAEQLDQSRRQLLQTVLRGLDDPATPALCASYGPEANLRFDFRARLVTCDALAQQHLRVQRELPLPAPPARPQTDYVVRELDDMVWDLGLASGRFPLLDEPQDWWHTPLQSHAGAAVARVARHSRLPRHLELARRLQQGPATPSQLRRHVRINVAELRCFLQACLMLNLLRWVPMAAAAQPGAQSH